MPAPTLLKQVMQLSVAEWKQLKQQGDAYHQLTGASTETPATKLVLGADALPLLHGISAELARRGVNSYLRPTPQQRQKAETAWAQVLRQVPKDITRPEQYALAKQCGLILARALERRFKPVPVTPKTMLDNTPSLLTAIDMAFPGYMAAGLLAMTTRMRNGVER